MLLLHRHGDQHCGDLWSFPGGKIEAGETPKQAAIRELDEETSLEGSRYKFLGDSTYEYSDRLLHFFLFSCHCEQSESIQSEAPHRWVTLDELRHIPMPEANAALIDLIIAESGR